MRKPLPIVAVAAVLLAGASLARAGVYNTAEEERPGFNPLADNSAKEFQDVVARLKGISLTNPPENQLRKRYLLMSRADARGRGRDGELTAEQRINLGAYLIRLGKYQEAVDVLQPAEKLAPPDMKFMVLSNLASAYQLEGQLERAQDYLERALKQWPKQAPGGFEGSQLERYKKAEEYQLKLIRLRAREARGRVGPAAMPAGVDDLFGIKFVGESGSYEAGKLSAEQQAKLPDDARRIVEQLLVWMPADQRLYWLWGELLNSQGKVAEADSVFYDLVFNQRWNADELREHRRVLQDWLRENAAKRAGGSDPFEQVNGRRPPVPETRNPMVERLTWAAIGAAAGVVVTLLIVMQVREIRRRMGARNHGTAVRSSGSTGR